MKAPIPTINPVLKRFFLGSDELDNLDSIEKTATIIVAHNNWALKTNKPESNEVNNK